MWRVPLRSVRQWLLNSVSSVLLSSCIVLGGQWQFTCLASVVELMFVSSLDSLCSDATLSLSNSLDT